MLKEFFLCVAIIDFSLTDDVLLPHQVAVSTRGNDVLYNVSYTGSADAHVLRQERYGALYSKDAAQTSVSNHGDMKWTTLSLSQPRDDIVVRLSENARDLTGYAIYFFNVSRIFNLPELQADTSHEALHFPGGRLTVNITAISPVHYERRFLTPSFVGVTREPTGSKIVRVPDFQSPFQLITNTVGTDGDTIFYEVLPPDIEGIMILSALISSEVHPEYAALRYVFPVESLPVGHQELFEEPFFGVSVPDKFQNGYCACPSNYRCIIECVGMGSNVESLELYREDMTRAYTVRQDIRHKNKYMQTKFVFDDVTKGEKGRFVCQGSNGSHVEEMSFNLIVYENTKITEVKVEPVGNELVYRCLATGYPRPVFKFYIDEVDDMFKLVSPTEEEPINGVYSATYRWSRNVTVTVVRCRVVSEYTADWNTLNVPQNI